MEHTMMPERIISEPIQADGDIDKLLELRDQVLHEMENAPVVLEEVGEVVHHHTQTTPLRKAAYYVVFSQSEHDAAEVGSSIKNVCMARFESKKDLKRVIDALVARKMKVIDIIKGKPLSFEISTKTVSNVRIGD